MKLLGFVLVALCLSAIGFAEDSDNDTMFRNGLETVRKGNYATAASIFRGILADPQQDSQHADALLWLIESELAAENFPAAAEAADKFIARFSENINYPDAVYLRGRTYFLSDEPELAVKMFEEFLSNWPEHPLVASVYYWIGESYLVLDLLEDADSMFEKILQDYPDSIKREASRYRRNEITMIIKERELLQLLQTGQDYSGSEERRTLEEVRNLNEQKAMERVQTPTEKDDMEKIADLLDAKSRLMILKEWYINELRKTSQTP